MNGRLESAADHLRKGGVAAFPTDTVTGLGCWAFSREGVESIFRIKGREPGKPLILFFQDLAAVEASVGDIPEQVRRILQACWPGSLTAILKWGRELPAGLGIDGNIGIRVPAHPIPRKLAEMVGGPLATTSANSAGQPPMRRAEECAALDPAIHVIGGESGSVPSTVADFTCSPARVLREGAIPAWVLGEIAGE